MDKIKSTIKGYLALYGIYAKMDFAWLLRDSKSAMLAISADLISNIAAISSMFLLAWRFGGIGGLSEYQVLFMLGYNSIVTGFFVTFGVNNNFHISRIIGRGQLEHMFIQPISLKRQILTMGFAPFSASSPTILGLIIIAVALNKLNVELNIMWVLKFMAYLLASEGLIIGLSFLVSSLTFYAPKACEEISMCVIDYTEDLNVFPLSGMSEGIQMLLVTVIPTGLVVWFPAVSLVGENPLGLSSFLPFIVVLIIGGIAAIFFKRGLNYYVKTGANRYSAGGFRR
ncbi:ABC transporter permease [Tyzzerella sp. OttesenSCG-928-J15]|nr:ABC transporter permease [Tyzzerella sp. OttesenSCG-928-J15]